MEITPYLSVGEEEYSQIIWKGQIDQLCCVLKPFWSDISRNPRLNKFCFIVFIHGFENFPILRTDQRRKTQK